MRRRKPRRPAAICIDAHALTLLPPGNRRKVRAAEMLSSAMERLLRELQFTGRLSVVVQNGRVLKSGYEEGYFRRPTVS